MKPPLHSMCSRIPADLLWSLLLLDSMVIAYIVFLILAVWIWLSLVIIIDNKYDSLHICMHFLSTENGLDIGLHSSKEIAGSSKTNLLNVCHFFP